jgi:hypothetical protein
MTMKAKKREKVDWAQIIYNSLCSELDWRYKYVKENKGDKKDTCQSTLVLAKIFSVFVCSSKGRSIETINQSKNN